jgi:hypothetical protein
VPLVGFVHGQSALPDPTARDRLGDAEILGGLPKRQLHGARRGRVCGSGAITTIELWFNGSYALLNESSMTGGANAGDEGR